MRDYDASSDVPSLPPRRKKRTPPEIQKPRLRKETPPGERANAEKSEMHPVAVVGLALLLMISGWNALHNLIYVPLLILSHSAIENAFAETPDEELADVEMPREQWTQAHSPYHRGYAGILIEGLVQASVAASLAGIMLWRSYAVWLGLAGTAILFLNQWLILAESPLRASFPLLALAGILVSIKWKQPAAWTRLWRGQRGTGLSSD